VPITLPVIPKFVLDAADEHMVPDATVADATVTAVATVVEASVVPDELIQPDCCVGLSEYPVIELKNWQIPVDGLMVHATQGRPLY
jgi:hypothetical protein